MDWSQLPSDLVCKIAGTLTSDLADRIRFAAVCKSWRTSSNLLALPPIRLPWLLSLSSATTTTTAFSLSHSKSYTLPHSADNLCAAPLAFFLMTTTATPSSSLVLLNPISKAQIPLPPLPPMFTTNSQDNNTNSIGIEKFKVREAKSKLVVMISFCFGPILCSQIPIERGARVSEEWIVVNYSNSISDQCVGDFAYHQDAYFVLDDDNESETSVIDAKTGLLLSRIPCVGSDRPFQSSDRFSSVRRRYLLQSSSAEKLFLLIAPSVTGNERFQVFQLKKQQQQQQQQFEWTHVRDIGNDTLFVSSEHAVALPSVNVDVDVDVGGYRANVIVFMNYEDEESTECSWSTKATGLSLFDISNGNVEKLLHGDEDIWEEGNLVWFVPSLS